MTNENNSSIPDPSVVLGSNYGIPFKWDHKDDQFIEFAIPGTLVMGDAEFFTQYASGELFDKEYPSFVHPCFAELQELVMAHMHQPMLSINEHQWGFLVLYQNTFGLITVNTDDSVDIMRRAVGLEDATDKVHYQVQYTRFGDAAVKRFDLAGDLETLYKRFKKVRRLRLNFAPYIDNPEN